MKNTLLAFFAGLFILNAQNPNAFAVQVETDKGIIEGSYDTHTGVQTYLGVPFAQPPVGTLRWKAPVEMQNWEGVKETKKFGPRPMQPLVFGDMKSRSDGVSEDCLYLNIWTTANRNSKNLPVLVYFYGGGNVAGDASEYRYDGESMSKKDIVVVTVNYRLNLFGYLAHPELSEEASYKASGNYGLLDQLQALKWVGRNIAQFGGDPNNVTIAGESAGSISVSAQMASPLSKNFIDKAIGESGAAINPTMTPVALDQAEKEGEQFLAQFEINSIEELRSLSTRAIYEMYKESGRFGFPMVVDGYFLPKSLNDIFNEGSQAQIPLLLGWNSAEIPAKAMMQDQELTESNFNKTIELLYPDEHRKVKKLYAPDKNDSRGVERMATRLASDRFIVYSSYKWYDLHRKNSNQPIYRYLYAKHRPPLKNADVVAGFAGGTRERSEEDIPLVEPIGAPHACEIEYAMGNLHLVDDYQWTDEDFVVSETFQNYFANFIKTGDPNAEELANWPNANVKGNPEVMVINTQSAAKTADSDKRFKFLDTQYDQ